MDYYIYKCKKFTGLTNAHDVKGSQYCEFYNETMCGEFKEDCVERETCGPHDPDKRNHCYVLWQYDSVTLKSTIKLKVSFMFIWEKFLCT